MILLVRELPLGPGDPSYEVRYVPHVISELGDHPDAEELMDELESVLGRDPFRPPGRRASKLRGDLGLWRYRPKTDNDLRVFYGVEGDEVWILGVHPRDQAYRRQNLETAAERFRRTLDG